MSKQYAGIDIGSRTIELVVVDRDGNVIESLQADTGFDPIAEATRMIAQVSFERIVATGYGRNLFEISFDSPTVTEIKAHAKGARALFPECVTILDIGGQDSKAIALADNGRVKKFEMNDRCAAGTGKFLEIMARTLGFQIDQFGEQALMTQSDITISSMCTVFAESEVTSLIAKGQDRKVIARGLHASVVRRAAAMINRISSDGPIIFTGGVARNRCVRTMLQEKSAREILVPDDPQMIGAFGAALLAAEEQA